MMILNPYRYGSGVTPPPSNVMLSLAMSGVDGGSSFPDTSANNFTVVASAGVRTKATGVPTGGSGGSAAYFDGTNTALLTLPNNAALNNFGTGDFSITAEVYCSDITAERTVCSCLTLWTNNVAYEFEIRAGGDLRFYAGDTVPMQIFGGAGSLTANTWHTVKVERISGVTTMKVDGSTVGTPHTGSVTISNDSTPNIGIFATDKSSPWLGYMRNFVITKG